MESVHYDISIIIPVYNVEKYIEGCLNSIINQQGIDNLNIESIIVDDCGSDSSMEVVERILSEYSGPIKFRITHNEKNSGQSTARNTGLRLATGKYIYFIDSDDDLAPYCLSRLYKEAKNNNYPDAVIAINYLFQNDNKKIISLGLKEGMYSQPDILNYFCERKWYNQVWNKLIKLSTIKDNNLYFADGLQLEDELWSFQLAAIANKIVFVNHPTYNYYIRPKSTISTLKSQSKRWCLFLSINKLLNAFIKEKGLENNTQLGRYFLDNILVNLEGFKSVGALDYQNFKELKSLNLISPYRLYRAGVINHNQLIAYSYLSLPSPMAYLYYKSVNTLSSTLRKLKK